MEKDVYAVLQLEAEEKELQQSEAQVGLRGGWGACRAGREAGCGSL